MHQKHRRGASTRRRGRRRKRKNNGSGTFCTVLMRHNKISSQVCQQVIEKNINSTKDKSRLIFEVYPVIVGDGEGSTDPTVSVVYQVPK